MSDGCPGCFSSRKGQDEYLSQMRVQAKKLAVEKGKAIAIVQDGQDLNLMDAVIAVENNYLIKEILSA